LCGLYRLLPVSNSVAGQFAWLGGLNVCHSACAVFVVEGASPVESGNIREILGAYAVEYRLKIPDVVFGYEFSATEKQGVNIVNPVTAFDPPC
jgi:hypothetical protein